MYAAAPELAYRVFFLLAIAVGAAFAISRLRSDGVWPMDSSSVLAVALIAALAGAKLFSIFERGGFAGRDLWWELSHGFRYPGGILGLVAVSPVLVWLAPLGLSLPRLADFLAPSAAFAMATVRLGCLFAGCCHGTLATVPWAIEFPRGSLAWQAHSERGWLWMGSERSLAVHPLQIYFCAASLLIGLVLLRLLEGGARRNRAPVGGRSRLGDGGVFFSFLLMDGLSKLSLEQLRLEAQPALQLAAAVFAVVGGIGLAVVYARPLRGVSGRGVPI